ncbi:MAG: hypothetical protein AAF327_00130 [Cyanobacteria bacterium P01_A01_bin.37]
MSLIIIATITTTATTSLTYYLLSRPWCIDFESDGRQTILYGTRLCSNAYEPEATAQFSEKGLVLDN